MAEQLVILALILLSLHLANSFTPLSSTSHLAHSLSTGGSSYAVPNRLQSILLARSSDEEDNDDDDDEDEEEELITKDKFFRELMGLEDGGRKKPKGKQKSIKRPHDNRDALPFLVQVMTPPDDNALYEQQVLKQKAKKKSKKNKRKGGYDEDTDIVAETLGEYRFEKNTSAGDKIEIDKEVYLVTKSKCQYRYAGAQKFVMVRKILQVKPVQRAMQEDYLMRQFKAPSAQESE